MATPAQRPITWDWLKTALPILLVLVTVVATIVTMQTQSEYFERRLCILEEKADRTQETYAAIQTQLAEIQRDLQYLRRDVDRQAGG